MGEIRLPRILVGFSGNLEDTSFVDPHQFAEKYRIRRRYRGIGGTSINVALGLTQLGIAPTCLATVGADEDADMLRAQLSRLGITVSMLTCRNATSYAYVRIIENGRPGEFTRTVDSDKTHYHNFPVERVSEEVGRTHPDCAVATGCTAEEEPLIRALFSGVGVRVLNPRESLCADRGVFYRLLASTDILCINEGEFSAWLGNKVEADAISVRQLLDYGPKVVIVTLAEKGAVVVTSDHETVRQPAFHSGNQLVDATGAGDAFLAGFLAAHLTGAPLAETVKLATIVAGIKVTKIGGANVATIEEIQRHYPDWNPWKFLGPRVAEQTRAGHVENS